MKNRIRLFLIALVAAFSAASLLPVTTAQKRRDNFSHATASHKKIDCSSCHKVPTANWIQARGFPDVADYPGHDSCIQCHRNDFFRGNRPAICSTCHVTSSPRGEARFAFPVRSRSQEFSTIFPHDVHQNLIASSKKRRSDVAVAHFVRAGFTAAADDDKPQFNNCAICHATPAEVPKFESRIRGSLQPLTDAAAESFTPTAAFFKDAPNTHASCFNCHYQNQKPNRTDCAGCHVLTKPYFESNVIKRFSLKFNHQDKDHINKDCTTCHVRITQNADLKTMMNADVPILTCSTSSCHGDNIKTEISQREASITASQPAFQCTYCHTPSIGRFQIPPSHQSR